MVITFSVSRPGNGPRPINPSRDLPEVTRLLKTVFADELQSEGQNIIENVADQGKPTLFWRLDPFLSRLSPAYVWEEEGHIVGNVTLIQTRLPERFIIANVAVYPGYRRRGIARALMEVTIKEAARHGAHEIRLQVARDNKAAQDLYRSIGYQELGSTTSWRLSRSLMHAVASQLPAPANWTKVRELPKDRWREAYELDLEAFGADLHWPDPLPHDQYRGGLIRDIGNFLSGRQVRNWAILNEQQDIVGMASCCSEWGRAHQLHVRVHRDGRGYVESALLQKLLSHLQTLPRRAAVLIHEADDVLLNELLPAAGFRVERTLTQMCLKLKQ